MAYNALVVISMKSIREFSGLKLHGPFPVDLIIRTPEAVKQRSEMGDTFIRDILSDGKVLYEADQV